MKEDIAIIGISGRFPEANNLEAFYQNLKTGKDATRPISKDRKCNTTIDLHADYLPLSYIEEIHHFDHRFFNISLDEAEKMDPRQRLLLEEVHRTIESAGYAPSQLNHSKTALYMADTDLDYYHHAEQFSPVLFTGNLNSATAGRIARHFQFRGTTLMVDTACSSSLVALHLGLRDLQNGESDTCLVASAALHLFPSMVNSEVDMGVASSDGHTRSFSEDAGGSGAGEAIVCVLLKRLEDAQRDRDLIYAVIKSSAVNQDAHLSGSLTAPSSNAQKEAIMEAWERAEIDPKSITYVEAHGSATRLGDPIEIDGLNMAFRTYTSETNHCAVSSVKSNIGHTGVSAGLSGLTKVVLSLQHAALFPAVNFTKANPFIDFEDSAVYINSSLKKWLPNKGTPLRAGISSFGLSGTNCHVVMEAAPPKVDRDLPKKKGPWLLPITAKSKTALAENIKALQLHLQNNDHLPIADISYTLCCGRDHYTHRFALLANDVSEALFAISKGEHKTHPLKKEYQNLIFLFSDQWTWELKELEQFTHVNESFKGHWQTCMKLIETADRNAAFYQFAGQYALYHCLTNSGIETEQLLGVGLGELVVETLLEEKTLQEGLKAALTHSTDKNDEIEQHKLEQLIKTEAKSPTVFFNIGPASKLSDLLLKIQKKKRRTNYQVQTIEQLGTDTLSIALRDLFVLGFVPRWEKIFAGDFRRCPLPHYQFDRIHCWIKPAYEWKENDEVQENTTKEQAAVELIHRTLSIDEFPVEWTLTEKKVAAIWVELLKLKEPLSLEDDFFKLGGQSLYAIQMMNRIKIDFGVEIGFQEAFKWSTVSELAKVIDGAEAKDIGDFTSKIVPIPNQAHYEVTPNQSRLWFLDQFDEEKLNYILTMYNALEGKFDKEVFAKALEALIRRHESLRTVFINVDGAPRQKILSYEEIGIQLEFFDLRKDPQKAETLIRIGEKEHMTPLDLQNGPLMRAKLIQLKDQEFVYIYSIHHIICDGWSLDIINNELIKYYELFHEGGEDDLPPLEIQYKDYTAWNNKMLSPERLEGHQSYWLEQLKGQLPESEFPLDFVRPAHKTWKGKNRTELLSAKLSNQLTLLGFEHKASFFMVIFTAVKALYYRYTMETDIIIGTTISARNHYNLENQIGFYTSTLPIRTTFDPDCTFLDLLQNVQHNMLGAFDHQWYPFDQIVKDLKIKRPKNKYPLFNILVALRNTDNVLADEDIDQRFGVEEKIGEDDILLGSYEDVVFPISKYDLTLRLAKENGGKISLYIEHNIDLYKTGTIDLWTKRLLKLLEVIADHPEVKLREIPLYSESQSHLFTEQNAASFFNAKF